MEALETTAYSCNLGRRPVSTTEAGAACGSEEREMRTLAFDKLKTVKVLQHSRLTTARYAQHGLVQQRTLPPRRGQQLRQSTHTHFPARGRRRLSEQKLSDSVKTPAKAPLLL